MERHTDTSEGCTISLEEAKRVVEQHGLKVTPPPFVEVVFDFDYVELEITSKSVRILSDGDYLDTLSEARVGQLTDALIARRQWRQKWIS